MLATVRAGSSTLCTEWYQDSRSATGRVQSGVQSSDAGYTSVVSRRSNPCSWSGPTKCILPARQVRYPAVRNGCTNVGTEAGSSAALSNTSIDDAYRPHSIAAREGAHSGEAQYAASNTTLSDGEPGQRGRLHVRMAVRRQPLRGELVDHDQQQVGAALHAGIV